MNQKLIKKAVTAAIVAILPLTGCSLTKDTSPAMTQKSTLPQSGNPADQQGVPGVPGASITTSRAISLRIMNGVKNMAVPTAGNFAASLGQLGTNLPENTNPNVATGFDQVPLLAYAACSDIAPTAYGVTQNAASTTAADLTAARANLIAAGVNILDQHTGGLASTGPVASQVSGIFGKLLDDNAKIAGQSIKMQFISVCMTASTFGAQMMGY